MRTILLALLLPIVWSVPAGAKDPLPNKPTSNVEAAKVESTSLTPQGERAQKTARKLLAYIGNLFKLIEQNLDDCQRMETAISQFVLEMKSETAGLIEEMTQLEKSLSPSDKKALEASMTAEAEGFAKQAQGAMQKMMERCPEQMGKINQLFIELFTAGQSASKVQEQKPSPDKPQPSKNK